MPAIRRAYHASSGHERHVHEGRGHCGELDRSWIITSSPSSPSSSLLPELHQYCPPAVPDEPAAEYGLHHLRVQRDLVLEVEDVPGSRPPPSSFTAPPCRHQSSHGEQRMCFPSCHSGLTSILTASFSRRYIAAQCPPQPPCPPMYTRCSRHMRATAPGHGRAAQHRQCLEVGLVEREDSEELIRGIGAV